MKLIGSTYFNIEFCKKFNEDKLRRIYNGESKETLDLLIDEIYPKEKVKEKKIK